VLFFGFPRIGQWERNRHVNTPNRKIK